MEVLSKDKECSRLPRLRKAKHSFYLSKLFNKLSKFSNLLYIGAIRFACPLKIKIYKAFTGLTYIKTLKITIFIPKTTYFTYRLLDPKSACLQNGIFYMSAIGLQKWVRLSNGEVTVRDLRGIHAVRYTRQVYKIDRQTSGQATS
ncbi:hypothetical protein NEUTE2DRAFT_139778 [Neurospora tetrasperma FGSC 2509]|nr:hypothetical protein NEUTE2DRAFT_139778 [Neurospora tetrasperma FGSC 2509]